MNKVLLIECSDGTKSQMTLTSLPVTSDDGYTYFEAKDENGIEQSYRFKFVEDL